MKSKKLYKVTKPWGKRIVGEILKESLEVRRKIEEGGCIEEIKHPEVIKKMASDKVKNKMSIDADSFIKDNPKEDEE